MRASALEIAIDGVTLAADGPRLVDEIKKVTSLVVVERGQERLARVSAVGAGADDAQCVRMLTALGDVLVPVGARVMTREARGLPLEVSTAVREGRAVRAETIAPSSAARGGAPRRLRRRSDRWSELPRAICIPPRRAISRRDPKVVWADRRQAQASGATSAGSRLPAMGMGAPPRPRSRPGFARDLMRALAWSVDGDGGVEARLPLQEARLRRLLIAALIAEGLPFTIKWTLLGYGPVELRLRLSDAWPAFVSIDSARPSRPPHGSSRSPPSVRRSHRPRPRQLVSPAAAEPNCKF